MLTGKPFAASLPEQFESFAPNLQIGLNSERAHLVERLGKRVNLMWEKGLLTEIENLVGLGLRDSKTARQAIGYAQALKQIDGEVSQEDAIAETIQLTRRYARRQMSWFRRDPRINWFDYQEPNLRTLVLEKVQSALGDRGSSL